MMHWSVQEFQFCFRCMIAKCDIVHLHFFLQNDQICQRRIRVSHFSTHKLLVKTASMISHCYVLRRNHTVTYPQISDFTHVNQLPKMSEVRKRKNIYDRFTLFKLFCNKSYRCTQCDLHITAVYFKHLLTVNDCDTDPSGFYLILIAAECDYKP